MAGHVYINVSASSFSDTDIGALVCDKLWTEDNVEDLASGIVSECEDQEREDTLRALAEAIIGRLDDA